MNKHHWGIKYWEPSWYESTNEFTIALNKENICGSIVRSTWTLWDGDEWFEDAPVILVTDNKQLEFCANQIGEFTFSINSIDINASVNWCEEPAELGSLIWKKDAHTLLAKLVGKKILEIGALEYCLDKNLQELFNKQWVLAGVYLSCNSTYIEIFNALDCNGISAFNL